MQLRTRVNLHRVAPGCSEHIQSGERAGLVNDFAAAADAVVAAVDVEEILCVGG